VPGAGLFAQHSSRGIATDRAAMRALLEDRLKYLGSRQDARAEVSEGPLQSTMVAGPVEALMVGPGDCRLLVETGCSADDTLGPVRVQTHGFVLGLGHASAAREDRCCDAHCAEVMHKACALQHPDRRSWESEVAGGVACQPADLT